MRLEPDSCATARDCDVEVGFAQSRVGRVGPNFWECRCRQRRRFSGNPVTPEAVPPSLARASTTIDDDGRSSMQHLLDWLLSKGLSYSTSHSLSRMEGRVFQIMFMCIQSTKHHASLYA